MAARAGRSRAARLFRALAGALLLTALFGAVARGAPPAIDQDPILRVLRPTDVPGAENAQLPSGALPLDRFAALSASTPAGESAEKAILQGADFASSAISEFLGPGTRRLRSSAIEFESSAGAQQTLSKQAEFAANHQGPTDATASIAADPQIAGARLITYRRHGSRLIVALQLQLRRGNYIYSLAGEKSDGPVGRGLIERLLMKVVNRS